MPGTLPQHSGRSPVRIYIYISKSEICRWSSILRALGTQSWHLMHKRELPPVGHPTAVHHSGTSLPLAGGGKGRQRRPQMQETSPKRLLSCKTQCIKVEDNQWRPPRARVAWRRWRAAAQGRQDGGAEQSLGREPLLQSRASSPRTRAANNPSRQLPWQLYSANVFTRADPS